MADLSVQIFNIIFSIKNNLFLLCRHVYVPSVCVLVYGANVWTSVSFLCGHALCLVCVCACVWSQCLALGVFPLWARVCAWCTCACVRSQRSALGFFPLWVCACV